MEYIAKYHLKLYTDTPQLARLKHGFLIKKMFGDFAQKIDSTLKPDRSLFLYSAHDVTIANVLNSLGLFEVIYACVLFYRCVTNIYTHFRLFYNSCIFRPVHRVYISNYTNPATVNITFKCSIENPMRNIHSHWMCRDAVQDFRCNTFWNNTRKSFPTETLILKAVCRSHQIFNPCTNIQLDSSVNSNEIKFCSISILLNWFCLVFYRKLIINKDESHFQWLNKLNRLLLRYRNALCRHQNSIERIMYVRHHWNQLINTHNCKQFSKSKNKN